MFRRQPISVSPDLPVTEAISLLLDRNVHHLLVVADGRLLGVVKVLALCRALSPSPAWRRADEAESNRGRQPG